MICPHCGAKMERPKPRVHYWIRGLGNVCGSQSPKDVADKALVTCLSCQKTKAFKEAK